MQSFLWTHRVLQITSIKAKNTAKGIKNIVLTAFRSTTKSYMVCFLQFPEHCTTWPPLINHIIITSPTFLPYFSPLLPSPTSLTFLSYIFPYFPYFPLLPPTFHLFSLTFLLYISPIPLLFIEQHVLILLSFRTVKLNSGYIYEFFLKSLQTCVYLKLLLTLNPLLLSYF